MSDIPLWDALRAIIPEIRWLQTFKAPQYNASGAFGTIGRVYMNQFVVPHPLIVDRLCYQVGLAQAGNVRLAVYREGPTPDRPDGGALVVESASVAQTVTNYLQLVTVTSTRLERGKYFLAIMGDDITGTVWRARIAVGAPFQYFDQAYGAFTAPCPVTAAITEAIDGLLRVERVLRL